MEQRFQDLKKQQREERKKVRKKVEKMFGPGPHSKKVEKHIKRQVNQTLFAQRRARVKIDFERGRVRIILPGRGIRGDNILLSKLIQHFKPEEITRAALKYLKLKERFHI